MTLGVNCASGAERSTKLAGLFQTAEESSTCANRPPARPRSNAPGGGLRKPSPQVRGQIPKASVNPVQDTHERYPSRLAPTVGNERNNPTRFVRIFMGVLISSLPYACKQISGTTLRRTINGRFARDSNAGKAKWLLRPIFAFLQIGLEHGLHS